MQHANAAIREGRWKLYWPGDEASLKKDTGRDNPSYLRGIVQPHWEMPLDRQLDPPPPRRNLRHACTISMLILPSNTTSPLSIPRS